MDKQLEDRAAQEPRWTPYGEVEGDPFLELRETEKTEELAVGL